MDESTPPQINLERPENERNEQYEKIIEDLTAEMDHLIDTNTGNMATMRELAQQRGVSIGELRDEMPAESISPTRVFGRLQAILNTVRTLRTRIKGS